MGWFDFAIRKKPLAKKEEAATPVQIDGNAYPIPISAGRSSVDENENYFNIFSELQPGFAIEWLSVLEFLAAFDSDVSYALDNVVNLANTDHEITFDSSTPDKLAEQMHREITTSQDKWYGYSGGMNSLKNDLLVQLVINGCISAEKIPTDRLDGIKKVVRVNPKNIRFVIKDHEYYPVQKVYNIAVSSPSLLGYKELNPVTYSYIAIRRFKESPYATPPFLSVLESQITQKEMMIGFKNIMKKLGVLGLLSAKFQSLTPLQNEKDDQYLKRSIDYLNKMAPEVEKMMAKGFVAGFKDKHEFSLEGSNMNAAGAEKLMGIVESYKMAGLKQNPNMLGRQQSTSETFGRILLAMLTTQVGNYQDVLGDFLSDLYMQHLLLKGYNPISVKIKFKKAVISDQLKEEQANGLKIDNLIKLYNQGIISQQQLAKESGYDKPFLLEPLVTKTPEPTIVPPDDKTDPSGEKKKLKIDQAFLDKVKVYQYSLPVEYDGVELDWHDKTIEKFDKDYSKDINEIYSRALSQVSKKISGKIKEKMTLEEFKDMVISTIFKDWNSLFTDPISDKVDSNIEKVYSKYRSDKTIFKKAQSNSFEKTIPDPIQGKRDVKVKSYLKRSDSTYLSKFISDDDTKSRIEQMLDEFHGGNDSLNPSDFEKEFKDTLGKESWKIDRIVSTSVNRSRTYGHVNYMSQAEIEKYEIVEVLDRITCPWCKEMNGKSFEIESMINLMDKIVDDDPENIGNHSNFATSEKIEEFKNYTDVELQAKGYLSPPFHPSCRGRLVAVI